MMLWAEIVDFPGYVVSNTGFVRRLVDNVILTQRPTDGGYYRVVLWRDGKPHHRRVHVLMLEAWIGEKPSPRHVGAHAPDRNKWNNGIENLRWATPEENEADKKIHGTDKNGKRRSPLTAKAVEYVHAEVAKGRSFASIADALHVHRHTVSRVARGLRHASRAA